MGAASTGSLQRLQRLSSRLPGAPALKRRLHDNVTACGLVYRVSADRQPAGFTLLTYHMILERPDPFYPWGVLRSTLERQLRFVTQHCTVLSLDELVDRLDRGVPLPPRCVSLTFDDGYRDFYTTAWPLLTQYRLPATLFLTVDACERGWLWPDLLTYAVRTTAQRTLTLETLPGGPQPRRLDTLEEKVKTGHELSWALKRLPNARRLEVLGEIVHKLLGVPLSAVKMPRGMLAWDEVRRLIADGLTVGAHSIGHPVLTRLSPAEMEREISGSRQRLEERLGVRVHHFCYPFGSAADVSPAIEQAVQQAGFRSACTTIEGVNAPQDNRFALKRIDAARSTLRALVRTMAESTSPCRS